MFILLNVVRDCQPRHKGADVSDFLRVRSHTVARTVGCGVWAQRWRSLGSTLLTAALPCPRCPGPRRPAGLVGQCLRWTCSSLLRRLSCLPPGSLKKPPVPMLSKYLLLQACFPAVLKAHSFSTCSPVPPWSAPQAPVCLRSLPVPWGVSPHVRL